VFAGLAVGTCSRATGTFTLSNRGSEPIKRASVSICGHAFDLANVDPGTSIEKVFNVTTDSHFVIDIEFRSGRVLRKEGGYVTSGMSIRHEIVVADADIEITPI
jgi:hypothetical protein